MDIKKELNQVFNLYSKGDYKTAQELNNKILEQEPNNVYWKKYAELLSAKISNPNDKKAKVRWKSLKCPHCLAKIPFSWLTEEQKNKIKSWKYNNLEIKCPYCYTKFVLQKKKAKSILWIKIGDIATIDWKKYRTTGYVEYRGYWYEDWYSEWLKYIEWLLLWENNDYLYFSEWSSSDDWVWSNEFELSEKYIPKEIGNIDYIRKIAEIDWKHLYAKEVDKLKVVSVYWENSKNTIIWEEVEIYDFWDIIIEKESSLRQREVGFYKTKELSWNKAAKIFWKEYNNFSDIWKKVWKWFNGDSIFSILIFVFIFWIQFIALIPKEYLFWWLWIIILWSFAYFFKDKFWEKWNIILAWFVIIPLSAFLIFKPIFNSILDDKKVITLDKVDYWKKYELNFLDSSVKKEKVVSRTKYDYGWVKTYYERNDWLKFSVKDKEDLALIDKIKDITLDNQYWNNYINSVNEEIVSKMFNWKIYKLK